MSEEIALRRSIKDPIPAIYLAAELLSRAADAHIAGDHAAADALFREANLRDVWDWVNPAWAQPRLNVRVLKPDGDTAKIPKTDRPSNKILKETKAAVRARDGYRCRYCGIPVVDADIRKIAHALYGSAVPWIDNDAANEHAAFQCLWLQYDHVIPTCHGGLSIVENLVISCGLCNFGKDQYTLRQLALLDPRDQPPEPIEWDGLERLRVFTLRPSAPGAALRVTRQSSPQVPKHPAIERFFLPRAAIRGGFLVTPPLAGTPRWFQLREGVTAEPATRNGIEGYWLYCNRKEFLSRGLVPEEFVDPEQP